MIRLAGILLALALLAAACASAPAGERARVVRVIDGDTIVVAVGGQERSLRYIGIDTPEVNDPRPEMRALAQAATTANTDLVAGKEVTLVKDISETDRFGRLLRYVYVDGVFVNAELVRRGYAQAATYPPDVQYADLFLSLQREARAAGRGLWAGAR